MLIRTAAGIAVTGAIAIKGKAYEMRSISQKTTLCKEWQKAGGRSRGKTGIKGFL